MLCRLTSRDGSRLADLEQVADVAAAVAGAHRRSRTSASSGSSLQACVAFLMCSLPARGQRRAVAADPGLHDAVELVDAERDGLDQAGRIADAHQVARTVGRQVRPAPRRAPAASPLASPRPTEPADAVAVEVELDRALRASARSASSMPPCTMPNSAWSSRCVGARARVRPRRGALDRQADHVGRRRQRRAHVEHHLDVGAEQLLRGDGRPRA